jgi:hypothetical protein
VDTRLALLRQVLARSMLSAFSQFPKETGAFFFFDAENWRCSPCRRYGIQCSGPVDIGYGPGSTVARHGATQHVVRSITSRFVLIYFKIRVSTNREVIEQTTCCAAPCRAAPCRAAPCRATADLVPIGYSL